MPLFRGIENCCHDTALHGVSDYLIIYNIFYINVTTDIRYYGLLKTIGTTGRQLKRMVRGQAWMLSLFGVPLGLLLGYLVGGAILPALYSALDTGGVTKVVMSPWIFGGAAVFSLFVVYLSCIKPCRLATKVSPIEAVRYVENTGCRKKEKKTAKISALRLASGNLGRNKRKAAVVIASLSLSLILLNATYALVKGFPFEEYVQSYLIGDFQISHYSAVNFSTSEEDYSAVSRSLVEELKALPSVESVYTVGNAGGSLWLSKAMMSAFTDFYRNDAEMKGDSIIQSIASQVEETGETVGIWYCLDEALFDELEWVEGDFDRETFEQGGYAIAVGEDPWITVGDCFKLSSFSTETEAENGSETAEEQKEFQVLATAKLPYALSTRRYPLCGSNFVLCEKDFARLTKEKGKLYACVNAKEGQEAEAEAAAWSCIEEAYPELVITSKESLRGEFSKEIAMFSVVGGFLGGVLALIGILNLVNAMITGILARKQEFAMMQAVGMTGRQLERMLTMEGVLYGVWTIGISATLGSVVSFGLVYLLGRNMAFFVWSFRILPLVVSIPVIAVLSVVLPVVCYHALCKKSIIERLRLAEV